MASDPKGLGAKFDAHTEAEFNTREQPWPPWGRYRTLPTTDHDRRRGGMTPFGTSMNYFVGRVPDDWSVKLISRTIGESQLANQLHP